MRIRRRKRDTGYKKKRIVWTAAGFGTGGGLFCLEESYSYSKVMRKKSSILVGWKQKLWGICRKTQKNIKKVWFVNLC